MVPQEVFPKETHHPRIPVLRRSKATGFLVSGPFDEPKGLGRAGCSIELSGIPGLDDAVPGAVDDQHRTGADAGNRRERGYGGKRRSG